MRKTIVLGTTLILLQIPLLAYVLLQERTWGGPERDGAHGVAVAGRWQRVRHGRYAELRSRRRAMRSF